MEKKEALIKAIGEHIQEYHSGWDFAYLNKALEIRKHLLAMASKLNINPAVEVNCTRAINDLLNGIKWVSFRPMQKNMAEWRTP